MKHGRDGHKFEGDASKAESKEAYGMYKYFTEKGDLISFYFQKNMLI